MFSYVLIKGYKTTSPVLAVIPGAETGVELAEMLATRYGTRSNNEIQLENRRNKYGMQECLRQAKVRSVTQKLCRTPDDIQHFYLKVLGGMGITKCVVKPNESAGERMYKYICMTFSFVCLPRTFDIFIGSDSVFLCTDPYQVVEAFERINGQINGLGQVECISFINLAFLKISLLTRLMMVPSVKNFWKERSMLLMGFLEMESIK